MSTSTTSPSPATSSHIALCTAAATNAIRCGTPTTPLPPLSQFVASVVTRSRSAGAAVVVASSLLEKVRRRLPQTAKGLPCSAHRLFLAALILASKYTNDKTYKNKSWVAFTEGLFPVSEINLMERQFLGILDFDLSFTDDDYLTVMDQLAAYEARIASLVACSAVPPIHSQTHNLHYQHHPQATPPSLASSYSSVMKQQFHQSFSQGYMPSPANTASPVSLSGSLGI
ncbi:hypothetical protein BCR33DRAFT_712866 [Rhizoclosmatium globosum]|uniref:Cyclin N-terminal domain-containing protein n=1 Tax=Rhizoclosmatium globosum TaxID=329046 RepID=A0A1Y2CV59_9FUNG|nr:hypothetical protein BCR33DRAFT_712866 [Rhizoclosmatium globosum]|eukprot:ORY50902.1 hypothetical protein BCR33DRAFT_712866 [Rhizoclosmatium globosum]